MEFRSPVSPRWRQRWMPRAGAASIVLHIVLFATLIVHRRGRIVVVRSPGTEHGSRIMLTYSPGRAPSPSRVAAVTPASSPTPLKSKLTFKLQPQLQASSNTTQPATPSAEAKQGGNALGLGNVTVALATFFPAPKPDLSRLPPGTRGDVVIDVTIDEQGHIVETRVDESLGHGVDETVLATIQTWTFKPATKDGKAVASEQQILFHYERG